MKTRTWTGIAAFGGVLALGLGVLGCSGGTGDEGKPGDDVPFVADDASTGSVTLSLHSDRMNVGDTSKFTVRVKDKDGNGVSGLKITCDSEKGVGIVEPSTGTEVTDSGGAISGIVGCAAPGSYQFGCRLPVGANKRKFVTLHCEGDIPNGFDGFPGAGGGGLGGGTGGTGGDGTIGGSNADNVRVTAVSIDDTGSGGSSSTTSLQVDTTQIDDCDGDTSTVDPEPFGDTIITLKVQNDSNSKVTVKSLRFSVPSVVTTSPSISSSAGSAIEVDENGGTADFSAFIGHATTSSSSEKDFIGGTDIATHLGFKNVTFTLTLTNSQGDTFTITKTAGIIFDTYNRCG